MNLMEEMDTEKSNQILMLNTELLFQHGGVRKRHVIRGESRKISICLTGLGLRMEKTGE